jgi:hypothetical protein
VFIGSKKFWLGLLILALLLSFSPKFAQAAGITAISDTMSRIQVSQNSSHAIKFTTQNAIQTTGDTIVITFPSDFNFTSKTIGTVTFTHGATLGTESTELLQASADGTHWGAVFSGTQNRILTLTAPTDGIGTAAVAASDKLIITYNSANSANGSSNTTYVTTIAVAGSTTESGSFAIVLLTYDQYTVSATVDPTITFQIDNTATDFGTLSTSVKTSTPNITLTTSTNATGGYNISIQDQGDGANPGIHNSVSSYLLGSADASYNNTANLGSVAGYGIQATSATATIDARYAQTSNTVGGFERTAQALASYNGVADNQTVVITSKAKVTGSAPAGAYADTVTVIATANF